MSAQPPRQSARMSPPAKWTALGALGLFAVGVLMWSQSQRTASGPAMAALGAQAEARKGLDDPRLDVNTASREALEQLPGIGPSLAQRIVEDRSVHGPFMSLEELDRVPGIGPKTIQKLRAMARVGDEP